MKHFSNFTFIVKIYSLISKHSRYFKEVLSHRYRDRNLSRLNKQLHGTYEREFYANRIRIVCF